MAGNDREPIGRKGKPTRPAKEKVSRRQLRDEDYDDDYEDDYEDEEPMPRKGKGKGRKPRGKRGWFWLLPRMSNKAPPAPQAMPSTFLPVIGSSFKIPSNSVTTWARKPKAPKASGRPSNRP